MDLDLVRTIAEGGAPCVLVTILEVKGSAPRHPGTKMLVRSASDLIGTVGGGEGEMRAIDAAVTALAARKSTILGLSMKGASATGDESICGGVDKLLVEFVDETEPYRFAGALLASGRRALFVKTLALHPLGAGVVVHTDLLDDLGQPVAGESMKAAGKGVGPDPMTALRSGKACFFGAQGIFLDPVSPAEKLLVIGAGHVGRALVEVAGHLDFAISLADDRPEFLREGSFPPTVRLILGSWPALFEGYPFDPSTYAVIMTRNHVFDLECARELLRRDYRYAGLIGSARKVRLIIEQLLSEGFDPEKVATIHAPIGLDIAAESPQEIAVAILAELIAVRRNAAPIASLRNAQSRRGG